MDELRRQDLRRFGLGLLRWPSIGLIPLGGAVTFGALAGIVQHGVNSNGYGGALIAGLLLVGFGAETARKWSRAHEFRSPKLRYLWKVCEERLERFDEARRKHRKTDMPELTEMPVAVRGVAHNLRLALRRADVMVKEIEASEGVFGMQTPTMAPYGVPPLPNELSADRDTSTLYQLADRNVAEYRAGLNNLLAGVSRTEAQAAVFATTLDTLRLKMLGYRLGSRRPELETEEFIGGIHEAKAQMDAIDRALEDLEVNVFARPFDPVPFYSGVPSPVVPNPIPAPPEVQQRLGGHEIPGESER